MARDIFRQRVDNIAFINAHVVINRYSQDGKSFHLQKQFYGTHYTIFKNLHFSCILFSLIPISWEKFNAVFSYFQIDWSAFNFNILGIQYWTNSCWFLTANWYSTGNISSKDHLKSAIIYEERNLNGPFYLKYCKIDHAFESP